MNPKQILVVLGAAVLCGFALAQTPKTPSATERLEALEKEVLSLRAKVDASQALKDEVATLTKDLQATRTLANQLAGWAAAQASGAAALALVLDNSETLGFTWGINPDSRTVLLAGWRSFNTGLQTDVPKPLPSDAPATAPAKPGARPVR